MSFVVLQIAPGIYPNDKRIPRGIYTELGVLTPITCDGFYKDAKDAHEIASWMAEEFPNLQTLVVKVVVGNDPQEPDLKDLPSLPDRDGEAPPAFVEKSRERAKMTAALRYATIKRDGYRCRSCGISVAEGAQLHVDHIVPISKGGKTVAENLQTLCSACNLGKSNS